MRTLAVVAVLLAGGAFAGAQALGTAFTYQGRLTDAGSPASGTYDLQLALFDAAAGGTQTGPTLTRDDVFVTAGLFTTSLDFGAVFAGERRWLELRVRPGASTGSYTTLAGRQELAPSPNAVFSSAAPWAGISGKPAGFADDIDNDSGGDITAVTAGVGLTGGGEAGAVTVGVDLGGSGSAITVSRSDHDHLAQGWSGAIALGPALRIVNTGVGGFVDGVWGQSDAPGQARGLVGYAPSVAGPNFGLWGQADSTQGSGVFGFAPAASGATYGVSGRVDSGAGYGVYGINTAETGLGYGAVGVSNSSDGSGVFGRAAHPFGIGFGVQGRIESTLGGAAVIGQAMGEGGTARGVFGVTRAPSGHGVSGSAISTATTAYAGHFSGRVHVTGTLSKGAGAFKIDHPLDPENKYLYHSFVESPDMKNVYDGTVTTDGEGYASVGLPDWFEALNRDFRYQLTVIGQFAQAMVAKEVAGNAFAIRTNLPNVKVSWQVTGIRKDAFAEKHRIPVEEDKPETERGKYMHPVEHGQPEEAGVGWESLASLLGQSKLPE